MSKRFAVLSLILFAVFAALFSNSTPTRAQTPLESDPPDKQGNGVVSHPVAAAEQRTAAQRWTEAERAKAEPMEWIAEDAPAEAQAPTQGTPGTMEGQPANPAALAEAQQLYPSAWESLAGEEPDSMGTPGIFTRYPHNYYTSMWTAYPNATIGKLYFTNASGGSSYCTASVISPTVIVTAAHCLYSGGWSSNVVFVPADRFGAAPYGSFTANNFWVMGSWITTGTRNWDVGVVRLNPDAAGRNVSYYTGWLGYAWNYSYVLSLHTIGYASNLSTQYTHLCAAESYYGGSTDVIDMGCDMTYGSSGGPWIMNWGPFSAGYVDAVVSGPGTVFGTTIRGPRFSSANIIPLCGAAGC